MRCDDARAAFLANEAAPSHRDHLETCGRCRSIIDELRETKRTLESGAMWAEPDPGLEDSVVTLIGGAAKPRERRVPRRLWAAVAASIVLVATVGALVQSNRGRAPDWQVALPGTDEAPAASGTVRGWNESGGTRLFFDIDGLREAPAGSVYEVWFSRGPLHVSAGTFTGGGEIQMWTGIARRDYPRIWITVEPIDTDTGPSGVTVMDSG